MSDSPLKLFSRLLGNPAHPRIIVAHGLCGSGRNWLSVGEAIAQAGFCVELLDLRDHGQSPRSTVLDYPRLAEDVAAHIASLGNIGVIYMGHSMGGKLGMRLVTHHKDIKINGLCVVDSAPRGYQLSFVPALRACAALDLAQVKTRADADRLLSPGIPDDQFRHFLQTNLVRTDAGGFRWICNWDIILRDFQNIGDNPIAENDTWPGPSLFIVSDRSGYFKTDIDTPAVQNHFPQNKIITVAAGHNVHIEAPKEFLSNFIPWATSLAR